MWGNYDPNYTRLHVAPADPANESSGDEYADQDKEATSQARNGGRASTKEIYARFRRAKDSRREKLRRRELDDENERRKVALKKGGGKNLQSVDSFGKQAASVEFSDFMARAHRRGD